MLDIKRIVAKNISEQVSQLDIEQIYENLEYPQTLRWVTLPCPVLS